MITISSTVFATVTPFDSQGHMDTAAMVEYLHYLHQAGVETILVNGTTGEFPALTAEERCRQLHTARDHFPGTVLANVSATAVSEVAYLLDAAAELADAVTVLPPYYYDSPCDAGVETFFTQVLQHAAEHDNLPVFLYHFPRHTQASWSPACLARLARRFANLVGVKDSSGCLATASAFKQAAPGLTILVGADREILNAMTAGLDGAVTGSGNPLPRTTLTIQRAWRDQPGIAQQAQQQLNRWYTVRHEYDCGDIALIKAALAGRIAGFPTNPRPPLVSCSESLSRQIAETLRQQFPDESPSERNG